MGLKCSLLGHRFGDPDVEREREERGSEVVTTTREVAVCERCEEKRVLSENKEVTAVIDESELGDSAGSGGEPTDDAGTESDSRQGSEQEPEPDGDDLVSEAVKNVRAERDASGGMAGIDVPEEDEGAEIMSDEGDENRERGFGEWPAEPGEEPEPWEQDAPDADGVPADSSGQTADDRTERDDAASGREQPSSADERPFGTGSAEDVTPDTGAEIIDDGPDSPGHSGDASDDTGRARRGDPSADANQTDATPGGGADERPTGRDGDGSEIIDAEDHQAGESAAGERSPGGSGTGDSGPTSDDDLIDAEATEQSAAGVGGGGVGSDGEEAGGQAEGGDGDAGAGAESSFEETEAASPSRPDAYECPECGFETVATNSPLRAGDPCPECSAYLVGSERKT